MKKLIIIFLLSLSIAGMFTRYQQTDSIRSSQAGKYLKIYSVNRVNLENKKQYNEIGLFIIDGYEESSIFIKENKVKKLVKELNQFKGLINNIKDYPEFEFKFDDLNISYDTNYKNPMFLISIKNAFFLLNNDQFDKFIRILKQIKNG